MKLIDKIKKIISGKNRKLNEKIENKNHKLGGFRDRQTQAIYIKPRRGKFKGYMRAS